MINVNSLTHVLDDSFYFNVYMITLTSRTMKFLKAYSHSGSTVIIVPLSSRALHSAEACVAKSNKLYKVRKCTCCDKPFTVPVSWEVKRTVCYACENAKIAAAATSLFNS